MDCGRWADEWSYIGGAPDERIDPKRGDPFSLDLSYYVPRCRGCHVKFDKKKETNVGAGEAE